MVGLANLNRIKLFKSYKIHLNLPSKPLSRLEHTRNYKRKILEKGSKVDS